MNIECSQIGNVHPQNHETPTSKTTKITHFQASENKTLFLSPIDMV